MRKTENAAPVNNWSDDRSSLRPWLVMGTAILLLCIMAGVVVLLRPSSDGAGNQPAAETPAAASPRGLSTNEPRRLGTAFPSRASASPAVSPEELVAEKVSRFAANRRNVLHAYAEELKAPVPAEFEKFFDQAESGRWEDLHAMFLDLNERRRRGEMDSPEQTRLWAVLFETHGVAEVAHDWPAQQLLDYGHAVLGALRPGMVYLGGTDAGRFIPTLLNETEDGERHVVLTQNALADASYLQYAEFLYRDQLNALTTQDSEQGFKGYIDDAQKRFRHDQEFPNEPKQVWPGEDLRMNDGRFQVSGQVAVMAINERLVLALMEKNPEAGFAMEESFPFQAAYAGAAPLGPLLELRSPETAAGLSPERAAQSAEYWRSATEQLLLNGGDDLSVDARKAYSKMLSAQAGLLASWRHEAEAEQIFRMATDLTPASPEPVFRYVNLLVRQQRVGDAIEVAQRALAGGAARDATMQNLLGELQRMKASPAN